MESLVSMIVGFSALPVPGSLGTVICWQMRGPLATLAIIKLRGGVVID